MPTYTASPTVAANVALTGGGPTWTTVVPYGSGSLMAIGNYSNYLRLAGLGFAIPTGETVVGVGVSFSVQGQPDSTETAGDKSVLLYVGAPAGTDKATAPAYPNYPAAFQARGYGGAADLWGLSLTPTQCNDPTFGPLFSVKKLSGAGGFGITTEIRNVTVTVYTTIPMVAISESDFLRIPPDTFRTF